ncbi:putative cytokinetic ring protein SteA [Alkaliphilus peptidifermentans]|uniref:Uncharacterized membrane-anchored protein n=1 Tax=Alkaliphilus peptidifermentans DSM 18978 TaxID=1120976 RepID=A0A1G5KE91_9FIRM|nr:putative cytokinetic ring protein SteA [Alkaliphilus peptidifermentans]SCY98887.1 Uncharacterized membrane-anchored protein [Alkaliphilus peptidifermentans DSM 18978]
MFKRAPLRIDKKTKNLVTRLNPGEVAVIHHKDLDEIAALSLVEKKVLAVINCDNFISGKYPNSGPSILLKNQIPMYEAENSILFEHLVDGDIIEINNNSLYLDGKLISQLKEITTEFIATALIEAEANLEIELEKFIDNTLHYASKEKNLLLRDLSIPIPKLNIKGRHVLVVVRGKNYREDLETILPYIKQEKPVIIGVDGGGDALLEFGIIPDILIGDMDSVSDICLKRSKQVYVHAYLDGYSPGMERIKKLGIDVTTFPAPGTSEDIAMLLAYENGADLIVAVGTHSNMVDFLEKGRSGMASTLLVRMKIGTKLVDAKGVNQLYQSTIETRHIIWLGLASIIPIVIIAGVSKPIHHLFRIIHMRLRLFLGI